jgi:hypothetical protein
MQEFLSFGWRACKASFHGGERWVSSAPTRLDMTIAGWWTNRIMNNNSEILDGIYSYREGLQVILSTHPVRYIMLGNLTSANQIFTIIPCDQSVRRDVNVYCV